MRKLFLLAGVAVAAMTGPADAASTTYYLDQIVGSGTTLTSTPSYGTVTYADNVTDSKKVNVTIDLNNPNCFAYDIWMNIDPSLATSLGGYHSDHLLVSPNGHDFNEITVSINQLSDGSYFGKFDIQVADLQKGTPKDPITFTLELTDYRGNELSLDPGSFAFEDYSTNTAANNKLYNVVQIKCGTGGDSECDRQGGTLYVGSDGVTSTPVPEPASIALLGAGLVGVGMSRRRKARSV